MRKTKTMLDLTRWKPANFFYKLHEEEGHVVHLVSDKGNSTILQLKRYCCTVRVLQFRDGLCIRFKLKAKIHPSAALGRKIALTHALDRDRVCYTHIWHNEARDTLKKLFDVC